jgi:hypothetical protein
MIKGTYIFYEDGKEIYRSDNIITKFGKRFLTSYIAGNVPFDSKDMALGIANDSDYAVSPSNSRLGFEFYRLPISYGGIDIQSDGSGGFNYSVIYKTTIPQDVEGIVKEVGIYPGLRSSVNNYDDKFLADFEDNTLWTLSSDGVTFPPIVTSNNPRIGKYLVQMSTSGSSSSIQYNTSVNNLDISGYSVNDTLSFAFYEADANLANIKIRFYSSATDYYEAQVTGDGSAGNRIKPVALGTMLNNPINNPDAKAISKIGIVVTSDSGGSTSVYFDGIRINDEDTFDPSYGLISRSSLTSPLNKLAGRQVDIEYRLDLSF